MQRSDSIPNTSTEHQTWSINQWPRVYPSNPNESLMNQPSYINDACTNFTAMPYETQSSINGFDFDVNALIIECTNTTAPVSNSSCSCNTSSINYRDAQHNAVSFVIESITQSPSEPNPENRQQTNATFQTIKPKTVNQPQPVPNPHIEQKYGQPQPEQSVEIHQRPHQQYRLMGDAGLLRGMRIPFDLCRLKCCFVFSCQDVERIHNHYSSMNSREMQNCYMANLITPDIIPIGQSRMKFRYTLEKNGSKIVTCRKHFANCFGVSFYFISKFLTSTFGSANAPLHNNRIASTTTGGTC